jgi:hypothetical protein
VKAIGVGKYSGNINEIHNKLTTSDANYLNALHFTDINEVK